jgi:hypothetical protein
MAKQGRDEELEKMTMDFLKEYDKTPPRKRTYKSDRQMKRKSLKEIPLSNLSKKKQADMENKYYGIITGEDDQC